MRSRLFPIVLAAVLAILSGGCAQAGAPGDPNAPVEFVKLSGNQLDFTGFRVVPDKQYLTSGLVAGSLARIYANDATNEEHPEYGWKAGDPICIQIASSNSKQKTYKIEVLAPSGPTLDKRTGETYDPMPDFALKWVEVPSTVTIPPNTLARVPVVLRVPGNISNRVMGTIPNMAEFRILVTEAQEGMVATAMEQRWLIRVR